MVGASGFEPPTSWSRTRRSNQAEPRPEPNPIVSGWNGPRQISRAARAGRASGRNNLPPQDPLPRRAAGRSVAMPCTAGAGVRIRQAGQQENSQDLPVGGDLLPADGGIQGHLAAPDRRRTGAAAGAGAARRAVSRCRRPVRNRRGAARSGLQPAEHRAWRRA